MRKNIISLKPAMSPGYARTWPDAVYMRPTDVQVAKLCASHGFSAACSFSNHK